MSLLDFHPGKDELNPCAACAGEIKRSVCGRTGAVMAEYIISLPAGPLLTVLAFS